MNKKPLIVLLTLCVSSVAGVAGAAGPYVGVLGGSIEIETKVPYTTGYFTDTGDLIVTASGVRTYNDTRSPSYGMLLGWQFHSNFALETSYLSSKADRDTYFDATRFKSRVSAWSASALYSLPLTPRWSAHARVGGIRLTHEVDILVQGTTPMGGEGHVKGILYGAGFGMKVDRLHMRFDLQRSKLDAQRTTLTSIGVNWLF